MRFQGIGKKHQDYCLEFQPIFRAMNFDAVVNYSAVGHIIKVNLLKMI